MTEPMPSQLDPAIFVHALLADKPVIGRAMDRLGIDAASAAGYLVFFWGAVVLNTSDGVIRGFSDTQLELWARWRGERGAFAKFVREEHLGDDGRPREWVEWAGRMSKSRESARDRQAKSRAGHSDVAVTDSGKSHASHSDIGVTSQSGHTDIREEEEERGEGRKKREIKTSSSSPRAEFLQAVPTERRGKWTAQLDAWIGGSGWRAGKPLAPTDLDAGLAEYLLNESAPTFNAAHVKRYVEHAEDARKRGELPQQANGHARASPPRTAADITRENTRAVFARLDAERNTTDADFTVEDAPPTPGEQAP